MMDETRGRGMKVARPLEEGDTGILPVFEIPQRSEMPGRDACAALFGAQPPYGQRVGGRALVTIVCFALLVISGCRTPPQEVDPGPALPRGVSEHIPAHRPFDRRPYEFIWADRRLEQDQVLGFERLLGWRVRTSDGVEASFGRSQERQLWDDHVGAFTFSSAHDDGWAVLEPPDPIILRDPVDTVALWLHGVGGLEPTDASPEVHLILETAQGDVRRVPLASIDWRGWWMVHRRLAPEWLDASLYPLLLNGFEIDALSSAQNTVFYLDALSVFMEPLSALRYPPRPQRALPLRDGQQVGINTGEQTLHFPTNEWTVIPATGKADERVSVEPNEDGTYDLAVANGLDGPVYRIDPSGGLRLAQVLYGGEETGITFPPIELSGVEMIGSSPAVVRVDASSLYVEYERGDIYRVTMRGRTLVIDVSYRGRDGERVSWRGMPLSERSEAIRFPFLHEPGFAVPPVWLWRGHSESLFVHVHIDPYRSNASQLFLEENGKARSGRVGARYATTTADRRNDIHERFLVTVAPRVEQVLPDVSNPRAPYADRLYSRLALDAPPEADGYAAERRLAAALRRWGLDDVVYIMSPNIWRNEHESFSFRLRGNPHRGGVTALKTFIAEQQEQGWLMAPYVNYRVLSPLNAFWTSDAVLRTPSSEWKATDDPAYLVKPLFALEWVGAHGAEWRSKLGANAAYLDGHTTDPPWTFTDYDGRLPGAATFSQTFYADGDLMREKRRLIDGPVLAQAGAAALYAGLADGLIADGIKSWRPYLPLFKLRRVHPLAVTYGAGDPSGIRGDDDLDTFLADQIAYGNAGRVIHVPDRPDLAARSYYAVQALQARYLPRAPTRMMYWSGNDYVAIDEALASGTWTRSQLYVEYPGDLELWVNGSTTERWAVQVGVERYELPPSGWIAVAPNFLAFSGERDERRVDYVESEHYIYFDPRGSESGFRKLRAEGAIVLRPVPDDGGLDVLDITQSGGIGVHEDYPADWPRMTVECFAGDGGPLGAGSLTQDGPWWLVKGPAGTATYQLRSPP